MIMAITITIAHRFSQRTPRHVRRFKTFMISSCYWSVPHGREPSRALLSSAVYGTGPVRASVHVSLRAHAVVDAQCVERPP
jgi:hypothetical protein